MKRGNILNADLNYAIGSMGHGDIMIVCDAGFPIPSSAWRVDLAITQDLPDLETVLTLIADDFVAEKVEYAEDLRTNNPKMLAKVKKIFPDSDHNFIAHATILTEMASKAKVIVRTGAFDPWGNIVLYSGVDAPKWFSKPGVVPTEFYEKKLAALAKKKK